MEKKLASPGMWHVLQCMARTTNLGRRTQKAQRGGSPRPPCGPVTVNSSSHRQAKESSVIRGAEVRGGWRRNTVSDLRKCYRARIQPWPPWALVPFSAEGQDL